MNTDDKPTQLNPAFATLADELRDITTKAKDRAELKFMELRHQMQTFVENWGMQQLPVLRKMAAQTQSSVTLTIDLSSKPLNTFVETARSYSAFQETIKGFFDDHRARLKVEKIHSESSRLYIDVSWEK